MNLTNKGNFIINDSIEVKPKSLKINFESLASENSGRTLDGVMRIYWVFNKIRKVEIELPPMTSSEVANVLARVQGQTYNLKYWDPLDNNVKTITVYTSNSSADCYSGYVKNGLYQGVSFNAIEIAGEYSGGNVMLTSVQLGDNLTITSYDDSVFSKTANNLYVDGDSSNRYSMSGGNLIYEE